MKDYFIYTIGFIAQVLFSLRLIIQWLKSEEEKKVTVPNLFWTLSLLASLLLFIYGYLRLDFSIMLGQSFTYYIYIRNLQLQNQWQKLSKLTQLNFYFIPVLLVIIYCVTNTIDINLFFKNKAIPIWLLVFGVMAQSIFSLRFIYQWLYAEHKKKSVLPIGFWLLSLLGASLILVYAIIRKDPVLFIGHVFGIMIYIRNIYLNYNSNNNL